MDYLFYTIAGITGIYVWIQFMYALMLVKGKRAMPIEKERNLSILVAARNEEENILECLQSLSKLDYPPDKYEVLVGDDGSTDGTAAIIKKFAMDHVNFRYFRIDGQFPGLKGKQNVLAQLGKEVKGELMLVTDADVVVRPTWASTLAGPLQKNVAMTCGTTIVKGTSFLARFQSLDWLMGFGIQKAHTELGIPVTAVGNNMGFTREAYVQRGGYESIEFSIAEDFKLFHELVEKGPWDLKQLFGPGTLNISKPVEGIKALLEQRKRWFRAGGKELAWYNKLLLVFNGLVMPALILGIIFFSWKWILLFYLTKVMADFVFLGIGAALLNEPGILWFFLPYELIYQLLVILFPLYNLIPGKVNWKGRKY